MAFFDKILKWFTQRAPITSNVVSSAAGKYLGTNLTGAEREANEWTAMREDTFHQRNVAGMQAAGLNPALMYQNGGSTPNPSASVAPGSADPMSLVQLAMLPAQLKQMSAQTNQINADAALKRADTEKRKLDSEYQRLFNAAFPERNSAEVQQIFELCGVHRTVQNLNTANAAVSWLRAVYQDKENESYNDLLELRKNLMGSEINYNDVRAEFERIQKNYAQSTGFLMSSSEKAAFLASILSVLGIDPKDTKGAIPRILDDVSNNAEKRRRQKQAEKGVKADVKRGVSGATAGGGSR